MTTLDSSREIQKTPGYASATAFEQFLARIKNRNAPSKVDTNLLLDFGIPEGAAPPLLVTLKFLGLIDETGIPTELFRRIQTPLDEEFTANLKEIVEKAYSEVFSRIDISTDTRDHIRAYFGRNHSVALQDKMTSFFLYLCEKAGMQPAAVKQSQERKEHPRPRVTRSRESKRGILERETSRAKEPKLESARDQRASYLVRNRAEFWRRYIELLDTIKVSLDYPIEATEILALKNEQMQEALRKLTETQKEVGSNEIPNTNE